MLGCEPLDDLLDRLQLVHAVGDIRIGGDLAGRPFLSPLEDQVLQTVGRVETVDSTRRLGDQS